MSRFSRWNLNPPTQPRINWGHPATKGLRACYLFNVHPGAVRNLVRPDDGAVTITGSPVLSPASYGGGNKRFAQGIAFSGSDMLTIPIVNKWGIPSMGGGGAFSYHCIFDATANGWVFGAFGHFGIGFDVGASWQNLSFIGNTWEGGTNAWPGIGPDAPISPTQMFQSFPGNALTRTAWRDRSRFTNSDFRSHSTSLNNNLYIGGNWSGTASLQGRVYALNVWEGAINETIYTNHLFDNPFCFLERDPKRTYFLPDGGGSYSKTLTESLDVSDLMPKSLVRSLLETVDATDLVPKTTNRTLSQAIDISDTRLLSITKLLTQTVDISDVLTRALTRTISNALTLSDNLTAVKVTVKTLTELIDISDTIVRSVTKLITQTLQLDDDVLKTLSRQLSDAVDISDALLKATTKVLPQTVDISDTNVRAVTKVLLQTLDLTDTCPKLTLKQLSELASLADNLTKQLVTIIDAVRFSAQAVARPVMGSEALAAAIFSAQDVAQPAFSGEALTI